MCPVRPEFPVEYGPDSVGHCPILSCLVRVVSVVLPALLDGSAAVAARLAFERPWCSRRRDNSHAHASATTGLRGGEALIEIFSALRGASPNIFAWLGQQIR